ncbi:phosphopentomutase [Syntrophotalea carbinolica DSM 2380]|uniref:Phosphopentomutase n=1 Tax=Syntrophotalea carbinolica (strain DSM 2380 / NBRC 103641 / GraBd1) TaxID=338963 RepID=DEOB_SYNC1|nr:phosphopentomutase [Syntrophotalea carbinolica]Q3A248.1 RecName: Full=Phosphopentomutase; AltName: Full=Phosphodeoxyribomutase [Syntrophotalea carbinolica DSM 2380]ABA89559.1 phosphopentomutase [Syntrophotalea carbinolica DSM 2380]
MTLRKWQRVVLIVLDGVGVGGQPDASAYGDQGASTLPHVAERCGGLKLPTLEKLGLGRIVPIAGVDAVAEPSALYGRMLERSKGKDTTTGHWELAGLVQGEPFASYPKGFPDEIIDAFAGLAGVRPLGNIAASGTEILKQLGMEHLQTGRPIVYTSVDSVFQIAAHEEVMSCEALYALCEGMRKVLDRYRVGRVIARPFVGTSAENFERTSGRRDFAMPPQGDTLLNDMQNAGMTVLGVGKISDIFAGQGISRALKSTDNADGMRKTREALAQIERGLVFTNLVDFDMLYGHRLDALGFGRALEEFDAWLGGFLADFRDSDLLIITADHGCDPTTPGTDHTRESVPLLVWSPALVCGQDLGVRESFSDAAATIADLFDLEIRTGQSFMDRLL